MNFCNLCDVVGYGAAILVVMAFYMKDIIALRVVALCSNGLFLAYGVAAHIAPVILLHTALLPLNLWRLREAGRDRARRVAAAASSPGEVGYVSQRPITGELANRRFWHALSTMERLPPATRRAVQTTLALDSRRCR